MDPNDLPPELASDPALMKQLRDKGVVSDVKRMTRTPVGSEKGRHAFQHGGRTVYEWDQSIDEVNLWITPPPGVTAKLMDIDIKHAHLRVGIKGNPPFLNEDTGGEVIVKESFWSMDGAELTINLQKMRKGAMWLSALRGHGELDPLAKEEDKKVPPSDVFFVT